MNANTYRLLERGSILGWIRRILLLILVCHPLMCLPACGYDPTITSDDDDHQDPTTSPVGDDDTLPGDDDTEAGDDDTIIIETPTPCPDQDQDGACAAEDCNDEDPSIRPGLDEVCDLEDTNCDGQLAPSEISDSDGDGYVDCDDCGMTDPDVHRDAVELDDCVDNDCDGSIPSEETVDSDGDGYSACEDCNDENVSVYPGALELCDGLDNDCSGSAGVTEVDEDGDGYLSCGGDADCDDSNPSINPGASEVCNGIDDNCDGDLYTAEGKGEEDTDGDGYLACASSSPDCDDSDSLINPAAEEVCDDVDNNCDGQRDEGFDQDGDGAYTCDRADFDADCDDANPQTYPGATEICDKQDNNCDGVVPSAETRDDDGDSFVTCGDEDCDDSDGTIYPGAEESCNGLDDDCDGTTDEDVPDGKTDTDKDGVIDCLDDCPRWVQVDADGEVADGSYTAPWLTIQQAIDAYDPAAAEVCRYVQVRAGIYYENIDFKGNPLFVNAVHANEAVIDGQGLGPAVSFVSGESSQAQLIGFKITGGNGDHSSLGDSGYCGGGVRVLDSSPVVTGNTIEYNSASRGGGACILGSGEPSFDDNTVLYNESETEGGGLYVGETTSAHVADNTFNYNEVASGDGGGLYCSDASSNTLLYKNKYNENYAYKGGGLYVSSSCRAAVDGEDAEYNNATYGGGIAVVPPAGETFLMTSLTLSGNSAVEYGGGIYVDASSGSLRLEESVVRFCSAEFGGGIMVDYAGRLSMYVIGLTDNSAGDSGGGLYAMPNARIYATSGFVENNDALNGGGMFIDSPEDLELGGQSLGALEFSGNESYQLGGALYLNDVSGNSGNNRISLLTLSNNAAMNGGAVAAINSTLSFVSNTVRDNVATGDRAGGVLCDGANKMKLPVSNVLLNNLPENSVDCG